MDKKFKFSDQPTKTKIVYGVVAGVLCLTAIIVGIVAAASKKPETPSEDAPPPVTDNSTPEPPSEVTPPAEDEKKPAKLSFVAPVVGDVTQVHSTETPVFSNTLGEWRVHTGIDICTPNDAEVYASERGSVSNVYTDPLLGKTVEVSHDGGIVTQYSNLAPEVNVKVGDTVECGTLIGRVGDTSISELAEEPHLHFEMLVDGVSVNPLDYITDESKKASLGISEN